MQGGHERAWAAALAQEHAHQQELLAAFRGELGAFARECAAALTALDSCVQGLGSVVDVVDAVQTGREHADIVLDVARRLRGLASTTVAQDDDAARVYARLAEGGDLPVGLVRQADDLLRTAPTRSDRELLRAVVDAAGLRARIEQVIGPAPVAALTGLAPLARWAPALATVDPEEAQPAREELLQVLAQTARLAVPEGLAAAAGAAPLAASLHTAVEHVQRAARAVEEGKLDRVLAEARLTLERDLGELRTVLDAAGGAPAEWLTDRRTELGALTEEVREKLERIERVRRLLAALLPHLQLLTRALMAAEKLQALEARLDSRVEAGATAARLTLLLDLSALWDGVVPGAARPGRRRSRTRPLLAGAAVLVVAAGIGIALAVGGGSKENTATSPPPPPSATTTATGSSPPPPPTVSAVEAVFDEGQRATFYSVTVRATRQGKPTYGWKLTPPADDPGCTRFGPDPDSPDRAIWRHADTDGCGHAGTEHPGTVTVTITTASWECTATFVGSETRTGPPPQRCTPLPS